MVIMSFLSLQHLSQVSKHTHQFRSVDSEDGPD